MAVRKIERGHYFEDFEVGHLFKHHWGRTITEGDNSFFSSVTMNFNPAYFNREYAQSLGYKKCSTESHACDKRDVRAFGRRFERAPRREANTPIVVVTMPPAYHRSR